MGNLIDTEIIGRSEEIAIFNNLLNSQKPELIAIYGRRRVGKTYLIRTFFKDHICFEFTGTIDTDAPKQLYSSGPIYRERFRTYNTRSLARSICTAHPIFGKKTE